MTAPAERLFVLIALVGGLGVLCALPPFQAPDEPAHFFRAYQVSEGQLVSLRESGRVGGYVPASVVPAVHLANGIPFHVSRRQDPAAVAALFGRPLAPAERVFVDFPNTALHSPTSYLPQALGIAVARALGASALGTAYAGRLANLACWIVMMTAAIRLTPVRKWLFATFALAPMSLHQAASLSADALTNAACFLLVACCLRAHGRPNELPAPRAVLQIAGAVAQVALSKFVYGIVALSVLLIPRPRIASAPRRLLVVSQLLGLACLLSLAWGLAARGVYATYDSYSVLHRDAVALVPGVDPIRQAGIIVEDPLRYAGVLSNSLQRSSGFVLRSFVGLLGWGETTLRAGHVPLYLALLLLLAVVDDVPQESFRVRERALLGAMAGGAMVLVWTALYLHSTPTGKPHIDALHGRYWIPVGPLALLVLQNGRLLLSPTFLAVFCGGAWALSTGLVIATLLDRYY